MRTLAALLVALPLAAAAQAPSPQPPPAPSAAPAPAPPAAAPATATATAAGIAPPAQPCPPAPEVAQPPRSARDWWYIGFGVGLASGWGVDTAGSLPLKDWVDGSPLTLLGQFQAGVTLTPHLLFGADLVGLRIASDSGGVKKSVMISNYDAMLTWFPLEKGPFVRGGAGLSLFSREWTGYQTGQFSGANLSIGGGYAFWLGRTFNLSAHLDYSKQWYGANSIQLTNSSFVALWLGFDWY